MLASSITKCFALGLVLTIGCAEPSGKARKDTRDQRKTKEAKASDRGASSDYLLDLSDVQKFRVGRSKDEILADVQWRGNFEMSTVVDGREVCAISFDLFGGVSGDGGTVLWAIFVDNSFKKFVEWPVWDDQPLKVGEFRALSRAMEEPPVNIDELAKKPKLEARKQIDIGLTIAVYPLLKAVEITHARSVKKNADLRDQYNASRLRVGMSEVEVEAVLRAKPIESGKFSAGSWRLYGSAESVDVLDYLKYSNILVLYESGNVTGIYSGSTVRGEDYGIQGLRQPAPFQGILRRPSFSDLPPADAGRK